MLAFFEMPWVDDTKYLELLLRSRIGLGGDKGSFPYVSGNSQGFGCNESQAQRNYMCSGKSAAAHEGLKGKSQHWVLREDPIQLEYYIQNQLVECGFGLEHT